ncbi:MAG: pentapeptide repeat-containing protein [Nitrospirales bacterium]
MKAQVKCLIIMVWGLTPVALQTSIVLLLMAAAPVGVQACRLLEPPAGQQNTLWVHIEGPCLPEERRAFAVKAADVLQALEQGKSLDLQGVLVVDDLMLDHLPVQSVSESFGIPSGIRDRLQQRRLERVRVITGEMHIREALFEKVLATNLGSDLLIILGEVDLTGTVFHQSVDFSNIVFARPFIFANVQVEYEGFFIGAQFEQAADFSHVMFGTHSRFHKAVFRDRVTFSNTDFKGVTEFLEVEFQQATDFSRVHFFSGTGFSGSVFHGPVDFSKATADKELYFRFAEFKQTVSFREAQFHNIVDYTNARFDGDQDFSKVQFAVKPEFSGSNFSLDVPTSWDWEDQKSQLVILCGLVVVVLIFLWASKRKPKGKSA